jgi:excisionase family DNA binding protein
MRRENEAARTRVEAGASQREITNEHDVSRATPDAARELDDDATNDIIDVRAVARLLSVGRNTVYALVARDAIPHRRLGKQIRFHRAAIVRWLSSWSSQGAKEGQ